MRKPLVANLVPVGIVDLLEMVDIEHDQRQWISFATSSRNLTLQRFVEIAPVVQAGQAVTHGQFLQRHLQTPDFLDPGMQLPVGFAQRSFGRLALADVAGDPEDGLRHPLGIEQVAGNHFRGNDTAVLATLLKLADDHPGRLVAGRNAAQALIDLAHDAPRRLGGQCRLQRLPTTSSGR
jgi:hypothetical protein